MMNNKEILANAPVGNYKSVKMVSGMPAVWVPGDYRSLADIGRILELEEFIRRHRYSIKQNEGDATQRTIDKLLDGEK